MKIYTKTGDEGLTSLFGGARVPKDDLRIRTYGTFDELNAVLGMAITQLPLDSSTLACLSRLQSELFQLGSELATPPGKGNPRDWLDEGQVQSLEAEIDEMETHLPKLKNFILPGGASAAATLHLARTVCRRAERDLIQLNRVTPQRSIILQYVNRLSDYLFVTARYVNWKAGVVDVPWLRHPL